VSTKEQNLFDRWVSVKFDGKVVISASKKDQFVNFKISIINGKEYATKLGKAMSVQIDANDIDAIFAALQELKKQQPGGQQAPVASAKESGDEDDSAGGLS
jgi:hypothetical protein